MKKIGFLMAGVLMSVSSWAYSVDIISPTQDQTILYPSIEMLDIQVATGEPLNSLHTLYILVDDKLIEVNRTELQTQVSDLGLGRHTLTAQIKNEYGQIIAKDSRDFNIIINPVIPKKVRAEQEAAKTKATYDALPWYKKAKLKVTQGDITLTSNGTVTKTTDKTTTKKSDETTNPTAIQSIKGVVPLNIGNKTITGTATTK